VRFECPIYVNENILEEAGVEADANLEGGTPGAEGDLEDRRAHRHLLTAGRSSTSYNDMTTEELNAALSQAIDHEDYERAARIRDELNKRQ
jgi:excinuclease UvrABC helicase subunit UvrB